MYTNTSHNPIYRALVTYSDVYTGEIRIKIPSLTGVDSEVFVSYIGRKKQSGEWFVPSIGEQIIVTADDHNLTNIFWLQTDPGALTALTGFYGAFSDYTDQFAGGSSTLAGAVANQAAPMRFTTTDEANGVSIVSNSRITFAHSGVYNLQWSGQFENIDNAPHDVNVWLAKNGSVTGVVGSNGRISLASRKNATEFSHTLSGWNFVFSVTAGEFYEFIWTSDSSLVSIQTYPITLLPTRPSTASLVLTVTPVTKLQTGATGATGPSGDWSTAQTVSAITTSNLTSASVGKLLYNTAACTLTLTGSTGFSVGQRVDLARLNSAAFTIAQGSGATLSATPSYTLRAHHSAASIICTAPNTYLLVGDLG